MTDKKHHKHDDEHAKEQATRSPQEEEPENPGLSERQAPAQVEIEGAELEVLTQKLAQAEAKSVENLDGWQRAVAEFQNYKKRIERDRETDKAAMKGDLIKKVLPVLDDLGRALKNKPTDSGAGEPWSGIELIVRKLQSILEAEGLTRIEAEGAAFDPNFHEAIAHYPSDEVPANTVSVVTQNGFQLHGRVVRPSQVVVSAGKPAAPAPEEQPEAE
jgi:molecular chaperone GrpE